MILTKVILPLICLSIAFGAVFVIVEFICWATTVPSAPKIKYKSFKTFYNLNPCRWDLDDGYVWCRTINQNSCYGSKEIFRFGFIGYCRYCYWIKRNEKRENEIENAEVTAKMLYAVKQDIETVEIRAKQYQDQGIKDMQRILNHLNAKG